MLTQFRLVCLIAALACCSMILPNYSINAGELAERTLVSAKLERNLKKQGYTVLDCQLMKSGVLRVNARIKGKVFGLLVDTGAAQTHIDATYAKDLNLNWHDTGKKFPTFLVDVPAKYADLERIEFEGINIKNPRVYDTGPMDRRVFDGEAPTGIIGADILVRHRAIIDHAGAKLYLLQGVPKNESNDPLEFLTRVAGYNELSIKLVVTKEIAIEASIDKKRLFLIVDTGAIPCTLNQARTKDLALPWKTQQGEQRGGVKCASCVVERLKVGSVEIGPVETWNDELVPIMNRVRERSGDPLMDGILGANVLAPRQAIIDYPNTRLFLLTSLPKSKAGVQMVNNSRDELIFQINGRLHRVAAGASTFVDVPAGVTRYMVSSSRWGVLDSASVEIGGGVTYTLKAE